MGLNMGNEGCDACKALLGNAEFTKLRAALAKLASDKIYASLGSPIETRVAATSYALALSDVVEMLEAATAGLPTTRVAKPHLRGG